MDRVQIQAREVQARVTPQTVISEESKAIFYSTGLCVEHEGRLNVGPQSTHIPASSPLVSRHHTNWRMQALRAMDHHDKSRELFFTSPLTIAKDDVPWVRERLLVVIEKIADRVRESESEELCCLNLDWFVD